MHETQTFPATPEQLRQIRGFISRCAIRDSFSSVVDDLLIAVSEASANAVLHAGSPVVKVSWKPSGDRVEVTVEDEGVFVARAGIPEIDGVGHRGIMLMTAVMDEVTIAKGSAERPGTGVRLVKRKASQLA